MVLTDNVEKLANKLVSLRTGDDYKSIEELKMDILSLENDLLVLKCIATLARIGDIGENTAAVKEFLSEVENEAKKNTDILSRDRVTEYIENIIPKEQRVSFYLHIEPPSYDDNSKLLNFKEKIEGCNDELIILVTEAISEAQARLKILKSLYRESVMFYNALQLEL